MMLLVVIVGLQRHPGRWDQPTLLLLVLLLLPMLLSVLEA